MSRNNIINPKIIRMSSKKIQNPPPEEKVCFNCKHMLWMVAIGQGVKCRARDMYAIPNRWYSCEKFEYREEPKKKEE